jgi:hypothetical protein
MHGHGALAPVPPLTYPRECASHPTYMPGSPAPGVCHMLSSAHFQATYLSSHTPTFPPALSQLVTPSCLPPSLVALPYPPPTQEDMAATLANTNLQDLSVDVYCSGYLKWDFLALLLLGTVFRSVRCSTPAASVAPSTICPQPALLVTHCTFLRLDIPCHDAASYAINDISIHHALYNLNHLYNLNFDSLI